MKRDEKVHNRLNQIVDDFVLRYHLSENDYQRKATDRWFSRFFNDLTESSEYHERYEARKKNPELKKLNKMTWEDETN